MDEDAVFRERQEKFVRRSFQTARLPRLVSTKGACAILGVSKMTLDRWQRPGSGALGPDRTYLIPALRIDDADDVVLRRRGEELAAQADEALTAGRRKEAAALRKEAELSLAAADDLFEAGPAGDRPLWVRTDVERFAVEKGRQRAAYTRKSGAADA